MPEQSSLKDRLASLEHRVNLLVRADPRDSVSIDQSFPRADSTLPIVADETNHGMAIRIVLSEMRDTVPYDSASVQELRSHRLVIVAGIGFAALDVILGESFSLDSADSPNGEVIHRRRAMIVADTEQYRAFRRGLHVGANIRSWLGVPLLDRDELVGMITLDKQEPDFYTSEHLRLSEAFARMIATIIVQSRQRKTSSHDG